MAQLQLKSLLGKANALLERGYELFGYTIVNKSAMESLIIECNKCIPADIKEAEMLLARKEEIVKDAQARAERIIQDAVAEQERLISRDEVSKRLQEVITNQKQQVEQYCENLQANAIKEAEEIKVSAIRKAATIQEGAEDYAAQIFDNMAQNISGFLNNIQMCQKALAEQRIGRQSQMQAIANESVYPQQEQQEQSSENSEEE
jgi:hypothetical protein